jgi:MYXO-CTERM domain-containing protein
MSRRSLLSLTIAVSSVAFAPRAHAAPTTVTDGDFANADWTVAVLQDDSPAADGQAFGAQVTSGGDPDSFRSVSNTWSNDGVSPVTLVTGQMRSHSDYAPAGSGQTGGPIGSIEFSLAVETNPDASTYPNPAQLTFFPVVQQGTAYYAADLSGPSGSQWSSLSWGPWTAADFTRFSGTGPAQPDFSSSGGPLTFGIAVQSGPLPLGGAYSLDGGMDTWRVTLTEPTDGGPGGAGGAGGGSGAGGGHSTTIPPNVQPGVGANLSHDTGGCGCRIGEQGSRPAATMLLLGVGALGLGAARRRKRLAQAGGLYCR